MLLTRLSSSFFSVSPSLRQLVALSLCAPTLLGARLVYAQSEPSGSTAPVVADAPSSAPVLDAPPTLDVPKLDGAPGVAESSVPEWNAEEWEQAKPQLNLLELDGYFRVRGDLMLNPHLGNDAPGLTTARPDPSVGSSIGGANMRARISPTLNITEDVQLVATFDLFDNLVLGSSPNTAPSNVPRLNILEVGQNSPNSNLNALKDSIQLKRLYGKVATRLGELRFGRQPNRWGMGIYANEGDCIDCDHGDNVDRVSFVAMLGSFYIVPMLDFMFSGPTNQTPNQPYGQPRSLSQLDDALQYSLQLARKDSPEAIKDQLARGKVVINYGLWNIFRSQVRDADPRYYQNPASYDPTSLIAWQRRDAFGYTIDGWFKLQYQKFTFEFEGLFQYAKYKLRSPDGLVGEDIQSEARQWALAIDSRYEFLPELYVRLRAGVASGDSSRTFGIGEGAYSKRGNFGLVDSTIDNFQFNRDYRVDLIMWRELLGTVTSAFYLKPEVAYTFSTGLGASFAPIYSQALYAANTPEGGTRPLGVELDFEAYYRPKKNKGLDVSLAYGLFIPFNSFRNPGRTGTAADPSIAHRLLARVGILF